MSKEISNGWFTIELFEDKEYDEMSGAHYVASREKWIPSSTSINLERAKSMRSLLDEYIKKKEAEQWLKELR